MKIIAYNSSHETSLCQYDTETKKIDFLYEEERFRRNKYWVPEYPNDQLLCIDHKKIQKPDHFIGCSFDRRGEPVAMHREELQYDHAKQREIRDFLAQEPLTRNRILEFIDQFAQYSVDLEGVRDIFENNKWNHLDDDLHGRVADQLGMDEFHYEIQHHLYHAECGYYYSPWNQKDEAIAIVMDGGGCKAYHDEYPDYQEVETIYHLAPDTLPVKKYQRLSNFRMNEQYRQTYADALGENGFLPKDFITEIDGVEINFSSWPSYGMNFSQMSSAFGFDKMGRAAGKVMGAASYAEWVETEEGYTNWGIHSMCNLLQIKSFEFTCNLIQRAIDTKPDCKNIILSGGFALNCTNNAKYLERFPDHQIFVDPVAHDGGTAVGAAIRLGRAISKGEEV